MYRTVAQVSRDGAGDCGYAARSRGMTPAPRTGERGGGGEKSERETHRERERERERELNISDLIPNIA